MQQFFRIKIHSNIQLQLQNENSYLKPFNDNIEFTLNFGINSFNFNVHFKDIIFGNNIINKINNFFAQWHDLHIANVNYGKGVLKKINRKIKEIIDPRLEVNFLPNSNDAELKLNYPNDKFKVMILGIKTVLLRTLNIKNVKLRIEHKIKEIDKFFENNNFNFNNNHYHYEEMIEKQLQATVDKNIKVRAHKFLLGG